MQKYLDPYDLPPGWRALCLSLDNDIQQLEEQGIVKGFHVEQLKEKFGELRLYFNCEAGYNEVDKLIDDYAHISSFTCCSCGTFPATRQSTGWILPFCDACAKEQGKTVDILFDPLRHVSRWNQDGTKTHLIYDVSDTLQRIKDYMTTHSEECKNEDEI